MRNNIVNLINSGVTAHTVAADTGLPRNTVYRIFSGEAKIDNISLKNAEVLNGYYLDKFGHILKAIEGIEKGNVELTSDDPDFYEKEYVDGPSNEFIVHTIEGHDDLEVFFAERDFVKKIKQQIYDGDTDDLNHDEMELNEYADRFNYDEVVAYRVDGGEINWI